MRVAERRLVAPFLGKRRQGAQHVEHATAQEIESAPHQDEIGVVGYVRAGCTKMDERLRGRRDVSKCVHVRHHVVAQSLFVRGNDLKIDVVEMCPHLANCFVWNRHAELALRLGQSEPEPAPETVTLGGRPQFEHRLRRVSLGERRVISIRRHYWRLNSVAYICPPRSKYILIPPRPYVVRIRFTASAFVIGVRLIWTITSPAWSPICC